ncbi:DUF1192 domain-containing protein [Phenylobacterium sp.]|uniref:DUF1192 domain-containing protein n=1 Tax=Phenylobacterium sp. TaxID=1871053 RepID=UPI002FDA2731
MDEPADVRLTRGQRLAEATREDLDLYAVEELQARIALLQAEVARTESAISRKQAGRAAADALFRAGSPGDGA